MKRSNVDNETKEGSAQEPPVEGTDPTAYRDDAGAANPETEQLRARVAELEKEVAELKDKYLRTLADVDNTRKRIRQQSEETIRIQRENFLRDLLPIVDNLERAVGAARTGGGGGQSIVEGVELVLRSSNDFLRSHGVAPVDSVGKPFDPQLHEAADHVHTADHPPNTVISEFHRGYMIGDRMLRPARVAVAKGRQNPSENNRSSGGNGVEKS